MRHPASYIIEGVHVPSLTYSTRWRQRQGGRIAPLSPLFPTIPHPVQSPYSPLLRRLLERAVLVGGGVRWRRVRAFGGIFHQTLTLLAPRWPLSAETNSRSVSGPGGPLSFWKPSPNRTRALEPPKAVSASVRLLGPRAGGPIEGSASALATGAGDGGMSLSCARVCVCLCAQVRAHVFLRFRPPCLFISLSLFFFFFTTQPDF